MRCVSGNKMVNPLLEFLRREMQGYVINAADYNHEYRAQRKQSCINKNSKTADQQYDDKKTSQVV